MEKNTSLLLHEHICLSYWNANQTYVNSKIVILVAGLGRKIRDQKVRDQDQDQRVRDQDRDQDQANWSRDQDQSRDLQHCREVL